MLTNGGRGGGGGGKKERGRINFKTMKQKLLREGPNSTIVSKRQILRATALKAIEDIF